MGGHFIFPVNDLGGGGFPVMVTGELSWEAYMDDSFFHEVECMCKELGGGGSS